MTAWRANHTGLQPFTYRVEEVGRVAASMGRRPTAASAAAAAVVMYSAVACLALLTAQATALQAAVTEYHPRIYVAPLPSILNTRTLTDYDVRRFFTQFGADPNGVWSNPIGESRDCPMLLAPDLTAIYAS